MVNYKMKRIVLDSLLKRGPNKEIFSKRLEPYLKSNNISRAPVNPKFFAPIDKKHDIVITHKAYEVLQVIENYNFKNKKEVPFVLFGKEMPGGAIVFDDIDCDFTKLKDDVATFDNIEEYLILKIRRFTIEKSKNKVICAGHTHPFNGDRLAFNYSFTDLMFHLNFLSFKIFANQSYNNKMFSLMKSITKDYNFIYYDQNIGQFLKVNKVLLQTKKKEFIPLSAYQYCDD